MDSLQRQKGGIALVSTGRDTDRQRQKDEDNKCDTRTNNSDRKRGLRL